MIISDRYGFLFVANLRTASSSVHLALGPLASIDLSETDRGKHHPLDEIYRRYGSERIDPLFKWAVIRRPTEYLWSLYRFHATAAFDGKPHSTRGKTFEEFCAGETHGWMKAPQSTRFVDPAGEYALDLLVDMDTLHEGFSYLKFRLGLPNVMLPRINRSGSVGPPRLSDELEERIRADYAADYDCIERYANRERTPAGFQRILEPAATAVR